MAAEQVVETVAGSLEGAATGLEEAAEVTRQLDLGRIGFGLGGLAVGLAFGFYVGYKFNRATIRAEVLKEAEAEIDQIRLFYHEKYESAAPKPPLDVVEARAQQLKAEEELRQTKPPVPVQYPKTEAEKQRAREIEELRKDPLEGWNYDQEIAKRNRNHPYIIHQNEYFEKFPEYQHLEWTYYAGDDILCDERDEIVVRPELVVGEENLKRFGHGASDVNTVYIRNDRLELEWEITRSFKSHAEEVLGLDPDEVEDGT